MGKYIAVGSKFKPYSFEELIRPYQMYDQAYKDVEGNLNDLATKSSVWEEMTNPNIDVEAHKLYSTYSDDLKKQAEVLSKQGLTPASRQAMLNMKQRYSSEIIPIEQAYATRKKLQDEYRELRQKNPTILSNIDPNKLSLDDLIKNPQLTPEYESGALITAKVADAAKQYAKQLRSQTDWKSTAGGQLIERVSKYGLSQEDVDKVMQGKGAPELEALIQNAIKSSPVANWSNYKDIEPLVRTSAIQGLYAGIGDTKEDIQRNQNFLDPMQRYQMQKIQQEEEIKKRKQEQEEKALDAISLYKEDSGRGKQIDNALSTYFIKGKDGKTRTNPQYFNNNKITKSITRESSVSIGNGGFPVDLGIYKTSEKRVSELDIQNLLPGKDVKSMTPKQIYQALQDERDKVRIRSQAFPLKLAKPELLDNYAIANANLKANSNKKGMIYKINDITNPTPGKDIKIQDFQDLISKNRSIIERYLIPGLDGIAYSTPDGIYMVDKTLLGDAVNNSVFKVNTGNGMEDLTSNIHKAIESKNFNFITSLMKIKQAQMIDASRFFNKGMSETDSNIE